MGTLADSLAGWVNARAPGTVDVILAQRSLLDTAAVCWPLATNR